MLFRSLLAGLALATAVPHSEAGPFRRSAQPSYQPAYQSVYQPVYQPAAATPTAVMPAGVIVTGPTPAATPAAEYVSGCVYDGYTYAGAAWAAGRDGRRYMHLFVR